jgi:hypothetical protein
MVSDDICRGLIERRRFPLPWFVEERHACFCLRDHSGQALAYIYYEDEPGRRSAANCSRSEIGASTSSKFEPRRFNFSIVMMSYNGEGLIAGKIPKR